MIYIFFLKETKSLKLIIPIILSEVTWMQRLTTPPQKKKTKKNTTYLFIIAIG
jgi:hypothetical protein